MLMRLPCALQELRGIGLAGYEAPEWKTKAMGKAPTFGYSDVRPIKEQRESLPVFKLRDQLIQAVNEHQVLSIATLQHYCTTSGRLHTAWLPQGAVPEVASCTHPAFDPHVSCCTYEMYGR